MTNWKRLSPWWTTTDFIGAHVSRMHNQKLNRPDVIDIDGTVESADCLTVKIVGYHSVLTTPYHSTAKWYVDIDSIDFESEDILDDDPPHVQLYPQDDWSPNKKKNQDILEASIFSGPII